MICITIYHVLIFYSAIMFPVLFFNILILLYFYKCLYQFSTWEKKCSPLHLQNYFISVHLLIHIILSRTCMIIRWAQPDGIIYLVPWIPATTAAKSLQSCPTLCDPIDGSPPGSPVPGILQARTLEWVAIAFSNAGKWKVKVKSLSLVWLLATPMDCGPPGSSIRGIFQARLLEWGAIAFSALNS